MITDVFWNNTSKNYCDYRDFYYYDPDEISYGISLIEKKLDNQICENCKYFEESKSIYGDGYCNNTDWMFNNPPVYKEFSCNKFIKRK